MEGSPFICPEAGIVDSISIYCKSRAQANSWACAIYKFSDGSLVAYTLEKTFGPDAQYHWETFVFSTPPNLEAGTNYLLVIWGSNADCLAVRGNTATSYSNGTTVYNYPNFPPTHNMLPMSAGPFSIYCTYTPIPACSDPYGLEGDIICGDSNYGQDPTHLYRCDCVGGVCSWTDLSYDPSCDVPHCIDPPGDEGDIICGDPAYGQDSTHLYRCDCVGGVCSWTDLGYDPSCDLPDCTNPDGNEGDIICGDASYGQDPTHLYRCDCVGGVCSWTDLGYDPSCDVPYITYYVANAANGGNDLNSGTSPGEPWETIGKVRSEMVSGGVIQTGDHILFNGGDTFSDAQLGMRKGGIAANPMIIGSYGTGKAIIGFPGGATINQIQNNLEYTIFEDLILSGSGGVGLRYAQTANNITVRNVECYSMASHCIRMSFDVDTYLIENCILNPSNPGAHGVVSEGSNGTVRNCIIQNCKDGVNIHLGTGGIYDPTGSNHLLENLTIDNTSEAGIDLATGIGAQNFILRNCETSNCSQAGLSISHGAYDVLVENCYSHDNGPSGVGLIINGAQKVIVKDSIIEGFRDGIQIYGIDAAQPAGDILLENNIIRETNGQGDYVVRIGNPSGGSFFTGDPVVFNNNVIIADTTDTILQFRGGNHPTDPFFNFTYNIWWRTNGNSEPFGTDATQGDFTFAYWNSLYSTETFQEPPVCSNPFGWEDEIICGDSNYGQDPTHLYRCDCIGGVCSWTDLGYEPSCDVPHCDYPFGNEGDEICGDPAYGQDPTHLYRCDCVGGVCQWTDLGHSSTCDLEEPCTNPLGIHGDIICGDPSYGQDPTHQYQCVDGVWVDLGYNTDCDVEEPCTNPPGVHGDIICGDLAYGQDPTHQYQCIDGAWTDLGYSSTCDVEEPCTNPPGVHGDIICGDASYGQDPTHQYQCVDGQWVDLGYNTGCDVAEPCANPPGVHGDIICGDPAQGQDPTHQYECIDGVWTDLGYNATCDVEEPCINPPGVHGDIICGDPTQGQDPTHQYECVDGQWVDLGYNSTCDVEEPCTNPPGVHGEIDECGTGTGGQPDTTHRYQCNDGNWDDLGENCPYCPDCYVPLPNWVLPVVIGGILGIGVIGAYIIKR